MKRLNHKLYPVFIIVLLLGVAGLGLGLFEFKVWIEPQSSDTASLPSVIKSPEVPEMETAQPLSPTLSPLSSKLPPAEASPSPPLDPVALAAQKGGLRVSNSTEHPVRVALLERQTGSTAYAKPAHWDFSPMEGGSQGLILSLPQDDLILEKGDIIVAFAQDGSRLYWGPYVIGETPVPRWNQKTGEWELVLQPY
ncbi:hypothetical protein [Coleofasciculus sp.]|uniref:hypothetical protein n=1 Tax=Coleofasciculus sp. TaxID=3100458 RepID=UPI0039F97F7C